MYGIHNPIFCTFRTSVTLPLCHNCELVLTVADSVLKSMEEQLKYYGSERTSRVQSAWRQEVFFYNLVTMYWTLNSIYMQFEYQYRKSSNVSIEHVQLLRRMFRLFEPREMLRSFVARGVYCLKLV